MRIVALQAQLAIVAADLRQPLARLRREARAALRPVGLCPLDPLGQRRGRQIEVAGDGADVASIQDEPSLAGLELAREPPLDAWGGLLLSIGTSDSPFGRAARNRGTLKPCRPPPR